MKAIALCSTPRLGFMDFMGVSLAAFALNDVTYQACFGVYWHQALSNGIEEAIEAGYDYIITCDYDSIFGIKEVTDLLKLADGNPHADAICTMQMGRFSGLLISTETGEIEKKAMRENDLVEVGTGHFGLTLFRALMFKDIPKPWFWSKPSSDGTWKRGTNKRDEDIYFWDNLKSAGKQLYVAPRIVIGHLEMLIKWPDLNLNEIYEKTGDYYDHGMPADCWK